MVAIAGEAVLTVLAAREDCPSAEFCKATKARAQGRAALGSCLHIGDRPGQCLVSDGFETRIGWADKVKPIQTERFSIHTLGQTATFSTLRS